ncbi:MAG: ABC transporter permease, partial [Gemmatimonadota bacterium]
MKNQVLLKVAGQSILKNKMRTLLTMLGVIIGVAAVSVMAAVGTGAKSQIEDQIRNLGTNLIVLTPGSTTQGGVSQGAQSFNRLTVDDVEALDQQAFLLAGVSPIVASRAQIVGGSGNWVTSTDGVDADYTTIRDWPLTSGVFFQQEDVVSSRKVAVLGSTVAEGLFPYEDPVGQQIRVRDVPFTVIGVLQSKGQTADGRDLDDVVLVPYTTAQIRLSGR